MIHGLEEFFWDEIESIEIAEEEECYDITLLENNFFIDEPNFIANDIVVHNCGMHDAYCNRKNGKEKYNLHPLMQSILGKTYGIMIYQEQVMQILHIVGGIPLIHCEKLRKAISKKKIDQFGKYKEIFIKNGQKNLGATEEYVQNLFDQIESFSAYGFNKSMSVDTLVVSCSPNGTYENKKIQDFKSGDRVLSIDEFGNTVDSRVVTLHDHGLLEGWEVTFDDGYIVTCSIDHKFLTDEGQKSVKEILMNDSPVLCDANITQEKINAESQNRRVEKSVWGSSQHQSFTSKTSTCMRKVPKFVLENTKNRRWCHNNRTQISLWRDFYKISFTRSSSPRVFIVRINQKIKHQSKKLKNQSIERASCRIVKGRSINFCTTRNSSSTCRKIKKVERGQSRKICQMLRSDVAKSQTVQNGSMASASIELGNVKNLLWSRVKTSRFCKRQCLDRSRWILSFFRKSISKRANFTKSSGPRRNVEYRNDKTSQYHVASIQHGMLRFFNRSHENRMVGLASGHDPIADTGRLVPRKIIRVVPVGKQQMYDLEVAVPTHNFLLPNGIVTSNSHSYAYSYISARQLWLMAHYPLEFYTSVLMCENESAKIKAIKLDAEKHGIEFAKVDINKSGMNFTINTDDDGREKVFFGFSSLKNLGEGTAERVFENQPYNGFEDFVKKFGADSVVLKPLVSLGTFCEENERLKLYQFAEYWKDQSVKKNGMRERFKKSLERYEEDIKNLLLQYSDLIYEDDLPKMNAFTEEAYELWEKYFSDIEEEENHNYKGEIRTRTVTVLKKFHNVKRKREQSIEQNQAKEKLAEQDSLATLQTFNPKHYNFKIKDEVLELLTQDPREAEKQYYGWQWRHDLEDSPDYNGWTFDWLLSNLEGRSGYVQVRLNELVQTQSKKGKTYFLMHVEDANGQNEIITIWPDDVERFKEELVPKKLLAIKVQPPEGSWTKYGFDAPPPYKRYLLPKNKEQDIRMYEIAPPVKKENSKSSTPAEYADFLLNGNF